MMIMKLLQKNGLKKAEADLLPGLKAKNDNNSSLHYHHQLLRRHVNINKWRSLRSLPRGGNQKRRFRFTGSPGINVQPYDSKSALSSLKLFLTDEMMDKFVDFTNNFAEILINSPKIQENIQSRKKSMFNKWEPTNRDGLWIYMTVLLMMGIVQKPELDMYWINDSLFETPIFHRLMSRERFHMIWSMIHFSEVVDCDPNDSLHKLRFFIDKVSENFEAVYTLTQNIAIDKYLSLWKGQLSFRVYIPSKRERAVWN